MKKIYILIILLISISLIGIIVVQIMSIRNALKLKNEELEQYIQLAVVEVGRDLASQKEKFSVFGSPKLLPGWPADQFLQNLRPTVDQRFTPAQVYEMLKKSFQKYGFKNKDFEFAVINRVMDNNYEMQTLNFSKLIADTARNKAYVVPLSTPGGSIASGLVAEEELWVIVPNVRSILMPSLGWMIGGSVLFTLVICTAFFVTVRTMLMQKKLSEIKSDFINNMTHEFKTPLATISLAVDALNNEKVLESKDKMQYFRGIIKDENKRMNKQVETILQAALLDKEEVQLNLQPLGVNEVIDNVVENFKLQLDAKNGTIALSLNAKKDIIRADEVHFTNLISNLIDNAVKYSREEGLHLSVSTQNAGNNIRIRIEDDGIGMSKETLSRVFEKFYRAHTGNIHNVKGFGLGLSYVKTMVEAQKGKIKAESTLGKGSVFIIDFPLVRKQNAAVSVA
ncbi:MAG: HAMP domain-containing histidine kinase [Chitinophagaceae bacterium]|nr:HAMP domain-containing histidine kinase [Chitinophagaceae bacterium]MCW5929183.1 HAMP domain-containing histidine kinase [Chitinophagaceae bacterium]